MKYETNVVKGDPLYIRMAMSLGSTLIALVLAFLHWRDERGLRKILKYIFSIRGAVTILTYLAFAAFVLYVGCYHSPY